jgi:hypothetical protein
MKICVDCRAPNPADRFVCYRCNERLDKIPDGAPAPGERSYPCLNCGQRMTFDAKACPACGRVPAMVTSLAGSSPTLHSPVENAIDRMNNAPYPVDWDVEPLPDGTVILRRTAWGRARADYQWTLGLLCVPLFLGSLLFGRRGVWPHHPLGAALFWVFVGLVIAVAVGALLWLVCGRDELRVGPGFLESRRELWSLGAKKRIEGFATLRVRRWRDREGETRQLSVENLATSLTLDTIVRRETHFLTGTLGALGTGIADPATSLGRFLSAQAGWPLVTPDEVRV